MNWIIRILFIAILVYFSFGQNQLTEISRSRTTVGVDNHKIYGSALLREGMLTLTRSRDGASEPLALLYSEAPIVLQLFSDVTLTIEKKSLKSTAGGGLYWTGVVVDGGSGDVSLFYKNGLLSGSIYGDGVVYTISGLSRTSMSVVEVEPAQLPALDCGEDEFDSIVENVLSTGSYRSRASTVVDVMIVYPTATQSSAGGAAAMAQEVDFRIAEANEIFLNSNMDISFRLVYQGINNDVPASATSAGDVDVSSVKALRDQYGADLVSHWNSGGSAGSGNNYSGNAESAYNTSNFSDVKSRFTFVHECGHNMGGKHDRYTYRSQGRAGELQDSYYKYGYMMDGNDGSTYRTVMSYNQCSDFGIGGSCTRVKHFSNPAIYYKGAVTGVAAPSSEAANNARRLGECAPDVSTFRTTVVTTDTYHLTVNGGDGDGDFEEGTQPLIAGRDSSASSKEFSHWTGDVSFVDNANDITTTVNMPAQNITLTAVYVPIVTEPLDTSNLSIDLVAWAGWEKEIDTYGSTVTIDTTGIDTEGVLSSTMHMKLDNEAADEYSWAKTVGYFDSTFDSVSVVKVTYTASSAVDLILEQEGLSDSGVPYFITLPVATVPTTLYVAIDSFIQYSWEGSYVAPLLLANVAALSFQPVVKGASVNFTLEELRLSNFAYDIVTPVSQKRSINHNASVYSLASGRLQLSVPKAGRYGVSIHSVNGREVHSAQTSLAQGVTSLSIQSLQPGVYLVTIKGVGSLYHFRAAVK